MMMMMMPMVTIMSEAAAMVMMTKTDILCKDLLLSWRVQSLIFFASIFYLLGESLESRLILTPRIGYSGPPPPPPPMEKYVTKKPNSSSSSSSSN